MYTYNNGNITKGSDNMSRPLTVQAGTRNTQLCTCICGEDMSTKAASRPISSTAFDTFHCILQESVYPVGKTTLT